MLVLWFTHQRNKENKTRVEGILEKAIDLMTSEITANSEELSWMSV